MLVLFVFKFRNLIYVIILGQPKSDNNKHDNDNINWKDFEDSLQY